MPLNILPSTFRSAAGLNAQVLVNEPVFLAWVQGFNYATAAAAYLKLYDQVTPPNPATDLPVLVIPLMAGGGTGGVGGVVFHYGAGENATMFRSGLAFLVSADDAPTDATGVAAGQVRVNFGLVRRSSTPVWI